MSSLTVQQLRDLQVEDPSCVVIDIRTKDEVDEGRIPGALWMDLSAPDFMAKARALPKDNTYCFYCASGGRTMMVVPFMEQSGFTKVYDLEGGIISWMGEGGAIVTE